MPEGDSLHRAAARLQPLVGLRLAATSPHPRGLVTGVAKAVDGRRLEGVEAVGKNLLLRFEGGVTVRSHLRMNGRWRVGPVGSTSAGRPWLVLRGGRDRGDPVERARADARPRPGPPARPGPPRRRVGSCRARRPATSRGRLAAARRGAPGSAARRGHREHVDVGGALGRPRVALACRWPRRATRSSSRRWRGHGRRCARPSRERGRRGPSTAAPVAPAAVVGRRSSRAARATTTAPPTGARRANHLARPLLDPFHSVRARVRSGDDRKYARAPCALPRARVDRDGRHGRRLRGDRRNARPPGRDQDPQRAIRRRSRDPSAVRARGADRCAALGRAERRSRSSTLPRLRVSPRS